ncbi:MAG: hypothetical protein U0610_00790 [bacterium]
MDRSRSGWGGARRAAGAVLAVVAMALSAAVGIPAARATTMIAMDLDQLARFADAIVVARCDEVSSGRMAREGAAAEGPLVIRTQARFTRLDSWKGAAPRELRVVQPGGVDGRYAAIVPGGAAFEAGRESVLFLQDFGDGSWGVIGLFQGKLDLDHDASGQVWVSRAGGIGEGGEAAPAASGAIEMLRLRNVGADGRVSIDSFHEQVRAAIARVAPLRGAR